MDVSLWSECVSVIERTLSERMPEYASEFAQRADDCVNSWEASRVWKAGVGIGTPRQAGSHYLARCIPLSWSSLRIGGSGGPGRIDGIGGWAPTDQSTGG